MKVTEDLILKVRTATASEQELRDLGRDNVYAIKSDLGYPNYRTVVRAPTSLRKQERTVQHEASNEGRDRCGDVVSVRGWDLTNFSLNPQLLWSHQKGQPPIGRVVEARKSRLEGGTRKALVTTSRFHGEDKNPFAEMIWRMVADGDLPAVSVGFLATEVVRPKSAEEAQELGVGEFGVLFKAQELLELSVVTVPAKADAVARRLDDMAEKGLFSWDLINGMKASIPECRSKMEEAARQRVRSVVDFGQRLKVHDDLDTLSLSLGNGYGYLDTNGNGTFTATGSAPWIIHEQSYPGLSALDDDEVIDRIADRVVEKLTESGGIASAPRGEASEHETEDGDEVDPGATWDKILDAAIGKVANDKETN